MRQYPKQLKEAHVFLRGCINKVEKITSKRREYDNYAYVHLNASNTLFIYANDELEVKIQLYVYNSSNKELMDTIPVEFLVPIILDSDVQTRMDRNITAMTKQLARQMMFPDANKRLLERAQHTKSSQLHKNNYIGWER